MNRVSDLRAKEVINMGDGRRIGFVGDLEIDVQDGRIDSLIVPAGGRLFGIIGKDSELTVPWERVRKVGEDIILVDLDDRYIRKYFE